MKKIDFENTKPYFDNGNFKWYIEENFKEYLENKQAENLPEMKNLACFVVVGNNVKNYVLINNKQNIIDSYPYTLEGQDQMQCKINILKVIKHFEQHEKSNL